MLDKPPQPWWMPAALLLLILGLLLVVYAAWQTPDALARIERRQQDLAVVQALADEQADLTAQLDQLGWAEAPPALEQILEQALPGIPAEPRRREPADTGAGWTVLTVDVVIDDLPLTGLGALLQQTETARPPWRLAEALLTASESTPGRGRAALVLESVERVQP